ncbi:Rox1p NDAI_0A05180 [Naumovozyma dairenensis CBS 421]|uniref:HMG box domain-containing protein n=1 Tax=Naumovozyma dairenensis (strain ATCC 10597 / BCRC 20456 / CBS 421 / NBRC 0211 / NRRL Y-12639) TaxID=1071378 RepID=G0W4D5_NAUDC|nr:hypothetical protein NDAI_0A05180 [Naumovozyma dairenensis CBS 421]CCD22673.1 hypothetical protein NDAI_0A05180 [Naumovozyma dairenensis CBS 421]
MPNTDIEIDNLKQKIKIPRPKNAFILFRQHYHKELIDDWSKNGVHIPHNSEISKILGHKWKNITEKEREYWSDMAKEEKKQHGKKYPQYKYKPTRRKSKKSKYFNADIMDITTDEHEKCIANNPNTPRLSIPPQQMNTLYYNPSNTLSTGSFTSTFSTFSPPSRSNERLVTVVPKIGRANSYSPSINSIPSQSSNSSFMTSINNNNNNNNNNNEYKGINSLPPYSMVINNARPTSLPSILPSNMPLGNRRLGLHNPNNYNSINNLNIIAFNNNRDIRKFNHTNNTGIANINNNIHNNNAIPSFYDQTINTFVNANNITTIKSDTPSNNTNHNDIYNIPNTKPQFRNVSFKNNTLPPLLLPPLNPQSNYSMQQTSQNPTPLLALPNKVNYTPQLTIKNDNPDANNISTVQ